MFAYPFAAHGVPIPHEKFFFPVPTRWPPLSGKGPAPSGRARRAGQKCCCRHRQTGSRSRAMSGGAALASSRAPEPWDDESDRDEDEDEQQPALCSRWWLDRKGGVFVLTMQQTTVMQIVMRPRCRLHRFCQPTRQHRQSWTTTQSLIDSGQHFLRTTRANHSCRSLCTVQPVHGGCDVADMKRALGMSRSKTYKWYLALFFYVIDVAVINAGVVWYSPQGSDDARSHARVAMELCMCLLLQDLVQSCLHHGGGGGG
jgi:hypothetical protein